MAGPRFCVTSAAIDCLEAQDEKSSNLHLTADSAGSIHKNARRKKFDPKKVRLGCGDLI